ncbi:steroid 17-alpha-hydroxylase/17,20 lyase-like [Mytilus californianus]|uniref:steroid 17-alpha-hydroxylase/17,20 lyase-like n=1 Tax=Mytilus californianus TaxID=6549 RepID=UPI0022486C2E|nr:steroid 17-alpha-hydroxylase/17,20 lyase-like [Mytilus californianus]
MNPIFLDWACTLLLGIITFTLTYVYLDSRRTRAVLPPGPRALPLLGNIIQLFGKDLHIALTDLSKTYGDLVWLKLGGESVIVINTMNAVVKSFVRQGRVFSGRPRTRKTVEVMLGEGHDICMNDVGPELKFHRKIVHHFLASQTKQGKDKLTNILHQEAESFHQTLNELCKSGKPFDPKFDVARVVANVLCQCILNKRFAKVDEEFHTQLRIIQDIVDNIESFNIVDMIPWLEHFPIPSWKRFKKSLAKKDEWMANVLKEHRETLTEGVSRDLVDTLLFLQMEATATNNTVDLERLSDCNIGHIVYELFGGGIESTTMSILWFMIYMIRHPEWQDRIYQELKSKTDESGIPSPFDRGSYPILEACIKEVLRIACVLPVGFPHRTMSDTSLDGYHIPKDTMVIMNIWGIHHDQQSWKDPYVFNPERFLHHNPNERYSYIPFGIGNRVCLGSVIAKMEVFLFCGCLLSKYSIKCPENEPLPDTKGLSGLTMRPLPFKIILEDRK